MLAACGATVDDLKDGVLLLPPQLREVSAIAAVDSRTIACVQDEAGALFFVDLLGEHPPRVAPFGPAGDYEGLARVGDDYWVLRSDGMLLQVVVRDSAFQIAGTHRLMVEHQEFEGLCFDGDRGLLLILPKDRVGDDKQERDQRAVYAFELATGRLRPEPDVVLHVKTLIQQAAALELALPTRTSAKGKVRADLKLFGSEVAKVPGSADLLILSAVDRVLLRIDRSGRLLGVVRLDPQQLPQPEGMTFLGDGRLLVASEGGGGPGRVCVVDWR